MRRDSGSCGDSLLPSATLQAHLSATSVSTISTHVSCYYSAVDSLRHRLCRAKRSAGETLDWECTGPLNRLLCLPADVRCTDVGCTIAFIHKLNTPSQPYDRHR